jgi:hypothetical protein
MEGRNEISINLKTKNKIVCAEHVENHGGDIHTWIILISHVKEETYYDGTKHLFLYRHVSSFYKNRMEHISLSPHNWGSIDDYRFYEATEEEKRVIKNIIKRNGFKYIKALNKLVKR